MEELFKVELVNDVSLADLFGYSIVEISLLFDSAKLFKDLSEEYNLSIKMCFIVTGRLPSSVNILTYC